jgi:putative ABC transport system substrate-binding protein
MRNKSTGGARLALCLTATAIFLALSLCHADDRRRQIAIFTPGMGLSAVHGGMQEGLVRFGYVEGRNITYDVEDTRGSYADLPARAAKLMARAPDLLFAVTNPHALEAKQATGPIVFAWVGDPVRAGLVSGSADSRSNLTGVSAGGDLLSGKRLEVLISIAPKIKRLLVFVSGNEPISASAFQEVQEPARKMGIQIVRCDVGTAKEIGAALGEKHGVFDAIFQTPSILLRSQIDLLIDRAKKAGQPLSVIDSELVDRSALISYGPDPRLVGAQAAEMVAKILSGAKPGDLTVQAPNRYLLAINQTTAKQIGITIPRGILEQTDRLTQ